MQHGDVEAYNNIHTQQNHLHVGCSDMARFKPQKKDVLQAMKTRLHGRVLSHQSIAAPRFTTARDPIIEKEGKLRGLILSKPEEGVVSSSLISQHQFRFTKGRIACQTTNFYIV